MEAGLIAADHVVMPFEAKAASVHGLNDLLETLKSIQRDANPHLNIIGLLPNRINSRSKHQQELLTLVQGIAPGKVLPFSIQERTSIEYALELQIPVWQNVNGSVHIANYDDPNQGGSGTVPEPGTWVVGFCLAYVLWRSRKQLQTRIG